MNKYLVGMMMGCLCIPVSHAQNTPSKKELPTDQIRTGGGWLSDGKELGRWWTKNPKTYHPMPSTLLRHLEGSYSYSDTSGNVALKSHKADLNIHLRKEDISSVTTYTLKRTDMSMALQGSHISTHDYFFKQLFRYAITDTISATLAGAQERNTDKYVQKRQSYFGGVHLEPMDEQKINLEASILYGYADMSFMNSAIQSVPKYSTFSSVEDYKTSFLSIYPTFRWQMTDMTGLSISGNYIQFLKDTDYFLWNIDLRLDFKLTENTSFYTSYTINHEETPFIMSLKDYLNGLRAKGRPAGEMKTEDTTLAVGIKFSF